MEDRTRPRLMLSCLLLILTSMFCLTGCGDAETGEVECFEHGDCADGRACVADSCVDAPAEGDSCSPDQEGEVFEDLECDGETWRDVDSGDNDETGATPAGLEVSTQPASTVSAGASFEFAFDVVDDGEEPVEQEGIEVTAALNRGTFFGGADELVELTDASGRAEFEAVIESADTDLVVTATSSHEALEGVSVQTDPFDVVAADADADNSSITGEGGVVADGIEEAEIIIELLDGYGNPVAGVVPEFVASGDGNAYSACTETDADGVASCSMTSTVPGEKTLEITEPVNVVGDTIEFVGPCDESESPFGGGDGSADDPYLLCTSEQLNAVGDGTDYLEDHFTLAADIDLGSVEVFNIIGHTESNSDVDNWFYGRFDGAGHTISNLVIDDPSGKNIGLFGVIGPEGVVENTVLESVDLNGATQVGALAGENHGTIDGVSVTGEVESSGYFVGGLVGVLGGEESGIITGAESNATVVGGGESTGGLVGSHETGIIVESSAGGDVTGVSFVGGLVGESAGDADNQIIDSSASGAVEGSDQNVGGLVGQFTDGTIEGSWATGDVDAADNGAGGLVGWMQDGEIVDSHATGKVASDASSAGGLVGFNFSGTIRDSYATGSAHSDLSTAGGLVGNGNGGTIENSFATGTVSGDYAYLGGLVGQSGDETISGSYATGDVDGANNTTIRNGGAFGYLSNGDVSDTYAIGDVTADNGAAFAGQIFGSSLTNCYGAGSVDADGYSVGGFTGDASEVTVVGNYWDLESTGIDEADDSGEVGTPLTTEEFGDPDNFSGWNFEDVWEIGTASDGEQRPVLQWQND